MQNVELIQSMQSATIEEMVTLVSLCPVCPDRGELTAQIEHPLVLNFPIGMASGLDKLIAEADILFLSPVAPYSVRLSGGGKTDNGNPVRDAHLASRVLRCVARRVGETVVSGFV